jgi:probable F420-dependent oxidoreductase
MTERRFRFAVQGGPFDDPAALAEYARHVESLGYDELYSFDHVGAVDPFVPLVVAATATERLRVGPLVINNELHNPVLLARTAASVDALSDGRLVLGVGAGYDEAEHESIGSPIRPPAPRVERLGESLAVVRSLLDTGAAQLDGTHVSVSVSDLGVRPANRRLPMLIGGHGERMVRLAGRFADIFQFTGLVHGEGGVPSGAGFAVEHLDERARWLTDAAGDRNAEIERSALVQVVSVDGSGPGIEETAARIGSGDVVAQTPFVLIGSVAQLVDKLHGLRDRLGISHYVIRDADAFAPVADALRAG